MFFSNKKKQKHENNIFTIYTHLCTSQLDISIKEQVFFLSIVKLIIKISSLENTVLCITGEEILGNCVLGST